jgi:Zn-dependent peptidase ImmA (M78 family)
MEAKLAPATPSVIAWAIRESGYSLSALAILLQLPEQEIDSWTQGNRPELNKLQAFADVVKRPFSAFLLPEPPVALEPLVKFRSASSGKKRNLFPEERRRIREAARLQDVTSWLVREMKVPLPDVPSASTEREPEDVAHALRTRLKVPIETQLSWSSSSEALHAWRQAVEALGVTVLMLPMGEESCRGFCIWDDAAPFIAINTAWLPEARIFTLFHELAHLATRTNSACAEDDAPRSSNAGDRAERWCERVAAAVLLPSLALSDVLEERASRAAQSTVDLSTVNRVATRFRVSRRAAALRLIERREAPWSLFRAIPAHTDRQKSGGGGIGRTRAELRRQWYGRRTMMLFRDAVRDHVLTPADVVDYLDISPDALMSGSTFVANHEDE